MTQISQKTATSVDEYVKIVSKLQKEKDIGLWFRGHAQTDWNLVPTLYREIEKTEDARDEDDEFREAFIRMAPALSDIRPTDKWDWYFVMQHHRTPTRLLDWTEGALIGLFFAVRENEGYHDAAVWAFDPWRLNQKVVRRKEILPPGEPGISKEDRTIYDRWLRERFARRQRWPNYAVAVYPRHSTRRIAAQRSCFTIHGRDRRGLDKMLPQLNVPLTKITIPSWAVGSIQECLNTCGVNEVTVFPDLDGLGKAVVSEDEVKKAERRRPHEEVYARLRPSTIHKGGVGLFAIRKIKKGTPLFVGDNDEMVWVEKDNLSRTSRPVRELYEDFAVVKTDASDKKTRYGCPMNFNRLTISWYLNNSQKPNVGCDANYNFFALTNIEYGDELTVNYSTYSE